MTPNSPVDAGGGQRRWLRRSGDDGDDAGGGDADVGGNLGPPKKTVASAAVAAPGGGGGVDVPTPTVDGVGGTLPAMTRNRRNRNWTRSSLAGGTWRRNRVTTVPGGPPLDHLW